MGRRKSRRPPWWRAGGKKRKDVRAAVPGGYLKHEETWTELDKRRGKVRVKQTIYGKV